MFILLDITLTLLHLAIIAFNLLAWVSQRTRKAHFISIALTAASWFLLGIWFGTGYCPFTDWQWEVKEMLGERNLPASFIEYVGEKLFGREISSVLINTITAAAFAFASVMSVYVNFIRPAINADESLPDNINLPSK